MTTAPPNESLVERLMRTAREAEGAAPPAPAPVQDPAPVAITTPTIAVAPPVEAAPVYLPPELMAAALATEAAPAPTPEPAAIPPEVLKMLQNPPAGMDPEAVLAEYQRQQATGAVPAVPTPAPAPAPAPAAAPAKPPKASKGSKGDKVKVLIACASGGLPPVVAGEYLAILEGL